jgi:hypothetical protein
MTTPSKFEYPDGLSVEDKLAYGVGALIMHWAGIESLLFGILECLVGRKGTENGRVVWLSLRTTEARIALIKHLANSQELSSETVSRIEKICSRFNGVNRVRNHFCHSHYKADIHGNLLLVENVKLDAGEAKFLETVKRVDKATINELAHAIRSAGQLNIDMWLLVLDLQRMIPSAPRLELPEGLEEYLENGGPLPRPSSQTTE